MKVSAIITVRNRTEYLEKCLVSLASQSHLVDEAIITDDGSDEDILGFLKKNSSNMPFSIKYVRQEYKGFRAGKCRNNAVRISIGDLLIFIDSDIFATKNYIKTFVESYKPGFFLVAYPIRLTPSQTDALTLQDITGYNFHSIFSRKQTNKITYQYLKDNYYKLINNFKAKHKMRQPKVRGGVCAFSRLDYFHVNGYDEKFIGWGSEDDNIGKRLYAAGIRGHNPFRKDFPIHLYHPPNHVNGFRQNDNYAKSLREEIRAGKFRCDYGLDNPYENEELLVCNIS